jgi:biopolymer transport protein ExbD
MLTKLQQLLEIGGLVLLPIVGCSVVALAITLERLWALRRRAVIDGQRAVIDEQAVASACSRPFALSSCMASATFSTSAALEVKLPAAAAPTRPPGGDDVVVRIGADGRVMHEGVVVDGDQLRARLRHARRGRTDAVLIVQADGEAAHRHVVGVMTVARDAGFVDVGIAVDPTAADERVTP